MMAAETALTITEVAARLGKSRPWVHQLLKAGRLTGPPQPPGRSPKNAPRVWTSSLDAYSHASARQAREPRPRQHDEVPRRALTQIKIALDIALEQADAEARAIEEHLALLESALTALRSTRATARRYQQIAAHQSELLTELLGPQDASELSANP